MRDPVALVFPVDLAPQSLDTDPSTVRPTPLEVTVNRASTLPSTRGTAGTTRRDQLVPAALAYAARGWHVFPLRVGDKRPAFPDHAADRCTGRDPRCRRAGRHVTWEERATTDPARIRAAWTSAPYGIGIATGPSGLLVIDLDQPKPDRGGAIERPPTEFDEPGITDGADVFAARCARAGHPAPLDTYTVSTGSGGTHLYFIAPTGPKAPELRCTAGHLGWLIDTRAHGGYVVAAPSTVAGRAYLADDPDAGAAPLPGWLADALTPAPLPAQVPAPINLRTGGAGGNERMRAYLESAMNGAVQAVHAAPGGQRNRAVYGAAVQLGQLVAGGALTAETVRAALLSAAITVGQSEAEAVRTIASGMRNGAGRPRYVPDSPASPARGRAA
ncbi:bifunctional DNA primase/polymerase [Kineosporia sp. J2-2]|uniref:Bifunctional DNA primase/polymerase n=1 Tax=Kineosporia corallincola TaxID=2835133 RepID=A0ABS5TJU8_9ACTN|nr:bifunctional DNA primase/polymerase [Kineosporia corallincola]MBT0771367.1 bifunctional DNA primase/polymerase [Kineosporia corallincola]